MGFDVNGQTALVTGANRGIGLAIVKALLAHGVKRVYAAARDTGKLGDVVALDAARIVPIEIELRSTAQINAAAETASDVTLVVNNAGILNVASPLDASAFDALADEMDVNVYGLLRMAQAFVPVLKRNGGGAFVQINSVASMRCFASFSTYSASKAAAYSMTQGLNDLLKAEGVQVLSVHPGPIATDMADEAGLTDMAEPVGVVSEGLVRALKAGEIHLFPDAMAQSFWNAYEPFARGVVESDLGG